MISLGILIIMDNNINNLFVVLSKYPTSNVRSPFENFVSEGLVYLLNYSRYCVTPFLKLFLKLFEIDNITDNYNNIRISTQESFYSTLGYHPIPDISITINETIYLIEVKVDAKINTNYQLESDGIIDQIQLYQNIKGVSKDHVYLLSKVYYNSPCLLKKNNILWHQIAHLIKNEMIKADIIEKFLMNNYIQLLEENFMSAKRISQALEPSLQSITNFMSNMRIIFDNINLKTYENTSLVCGWTGYNVAKDSGKYLWAGMYTDIPNKICFEVIDSKLQEIVKSHKTLFVEYYHNKFGSKIVSFYEMNNEFYDKDEIEQFNDVLQWINQCCKLLKII